MKRNTTVIASVLAGVVAVAVAGWIVSGLMRGSATDRTMAELARQPLVGLVLAENPAVEARLRRAVEEDERNPQPPPTRAFNSVVEIRKTIIGPTVSAADDAAALAIMKARLELVSHLQKNDLAGCRQFASDGIHDVDKLDREAQRLFRAMLTAMEAAYRNGKTNGGKGKPPNLQDFVLMLQAAGFTQDDFAKIEHVTTLPDAEVCALDFRIEDALNKLPEDKRGAFARYVIAH